MARAPSPVDITHAHEHEHVTTCNTCGRPPGCPECGQVPWPAYFDVERGMVQTGLPPVNGHEHPDLVAAKVLVEQREAEADAACAASREATQALFAAEFQSTRTRERQRAGAPITNTAPNTAALREVADEARSRAEKSVIALNAARRREAAVLARLRQEAEEDTAR